MLAKADRLDALDMLPLAAPEQTAACASAFARGLAEARHRRHPVLAALARVHRRAFVATVALGILHAATSLAAPYFLRRLLEWLELPDGTLANGLALATAIFVAGASSWLAIAHCFFLADKLSIRVRAGLVVALHAKTLKLGGGRAAPDAGQVLNVLSNDLDRVVSMPADIAIAIMSVAILAIAVVMLWTMLGIAALAGLAVLVALVPVSRRIARSMSGANAEAQAIADRRLAMTSDLLRGIRAIKLANLEGVFARKLGALRAHEGKALRRFSLLSAAVSALFLTAPVLVAFAVFALRSALGERLDVATAFSSIAVFGLLRPVLLHLPAVISNVVQAATSLGRIEHVLATPESAALEGADLPIGAIRLRASRIVRGETALLSDVAIDVAPGELVVITGGVGSGKSTLVEAMLGDRGALEGTAHAAGRIAVATQEPYLVSGTVRENILLGAPYDADRYRAALAASCMVGDLAQMPAEDATRITDRGGNLSGGQRQRLALARAFYARADIVILDDPFSSLDAVVGGAVAEQGLFELLRGTTRI
ncbi:MAG: ATP-binding cassette domain-containing protein, partial [Kofleriaceae bacterium]